MPFIFGGMDTLARRMSEDLDVTSEELREAMEAVGFSPDAIEEALREHEELLKEESAEEDAEMTGPTQYALTDAGAYVPVGRTTKTMKPGMYEPVATDRGLQILPAPLKDDEIIRFPDTATDEIVKDIETFWEREAQFEKYGMSFKRGMLLYGPPGSGKSTTLQLVAKDVIKRKGVVLIFKPDSWLGAYRAIRNVDKRQRREPTPIVTLMEDIDALLRNRESTTLNLLDGAEQLKRVVFLATTNNIEDLHQRVQNRPSRFDRRYLIDHPAAPARKMYLEHMLMKGDEKLLDIDRAVRDSDGFSLAHIKELLISVVVLGMDYDKTIKDLRSMHERAHSADGSYIGGPYA